MDRKHLALIVFVLTTILTAGAFAQQLQQLTADEFKILAKDNPIRTIGYGPELQLTIGLMRGQTMSFLFHPKTTSEAVFKGWLQNCTDLIDSNDDAHYLNIGVPNLTQAKTTLEKLLASSNAILKLPYRDLYLTSVTFPEELKALAASPLGMHLPFLAVAHGNADLMLNIRVTIEKLTVHGKFANFELSDFYHTQLSPGLFTDDDMDFLRDVFVAHGVLRAKDGAIDFETINLKTGQRYTVLYGTGYCCNRTTRKCQTGTSTQLCNMCGAYCCAGYSACP